MEIERDCPEGCGGIINITLAWEPYRPAGRYAPAEGGYWFAEDERHSEPHCGISDAAMEAFAQNEAADYAPPDDDRW